MLENGAKTGWSSSNPFLEVKLDSDVSQFPFPSAGALLHLLVNQQKMPAFARGKKRRAKRKTVYCTSYLDLTAQPPDRGCIEPYVDDDPLEPGTKPLQFGLEKLILWFRYSGGFRHGREPDGFQDKRNLE